MYKGKKVSLVLPAYNEEESVVGVLRNFKKTKVFDEIIVVDNNSKDKTAKLAKATKGVKVIKQPLQGYGYALQKGLTVAKGDIIITCDTDGTYRSSDVFKLLKQSNKYDFVWATRAYPKYILPGATMDFARRWANIIISKLIQFGFNGPKLTDLGATFRLINKKSFKKIEDQLTVGGIHFQPELTIQVLRNKFRLIEVPVYYGPRGGVSKISGSLMGGIRTAKKMLGIIIYYYISDRIEFLRNL